MKKPKSKEEKIFRSRSKAEEREDSKFLHTLQGDISKIREGLKLAYMAEKGGQESFVHAMVMRLDRVHDCLRSYLFDGQLPGWFLESQFSKK